MTDLGDDIGTSKVSPNAIVARLARLTIAAAAVLLKEEAKALGIPVGELRRAVNAARRAATAKKKNGKAPTGGTLEPGTDNRTEIRLSEEKINDVVRAMARMVRDVVYLRGVEPRLLTRAADADGEVAADADGEAVELGGVRHRPGALLFVAATPGRVAWHLDERARFLRWNERKHDWIATSCPDRVAQRLVDAATFLAFRPCAGVVLVPLMIDGRLVTTHGWHPGTGLFVDWPHRLPALPDRPTRAEAQAALDRLLLPFRGYTATSGVRRIAVAAAVLTAVLRPSLPTAPAILIDGNSIGCGKGKLARALGVLTSGHVPAIVTEGHQPAELEKRLSAVVLQGAPCVLVDNLQHTLASSTLESGLTEGLATIRLFNTLEAVTVPWRALVLITANNAALRRDLIRRALPVRITVSDEKPELRHFDFDPVDEVRRDRVELVAAAFTVVRAWLAARDHRDHAAIRQKTLGSFEPWADLIGGAVAWMTGEHPVDLIEEARDADPNGADERRIIAELHAWQATRIPNLHGEREWSAADAAAALPAETWAAGITFKGEKPGGREMGNFLSRRRDRVFGPYALRCSIDRRANASLWSIHFTGPPDLPDLIHTQTREIAKKSEGKGREGKGREGKGNCEIPERDANQVRQVRRSGGESDPTVRAAATASAMALLREARAAGVRVYLNGDGVKAAGPASAALLERLRAHKADIIEALVAERHDAFQLRDADLYAVEDALADPGEVGLRGEAS